MKHWLDHAQPPIPEDEVVVLLDPDMIFLRPITSQVRGLQNNLHRKKYRPETLQEYVTAGRPVAQEYGLGAPWTNDQHLKFNRSAVCPPGSPCLKVEKLFGEEHYSVGPPYLVIKSDMDKMAQVWTTFVPRVYSFYPYLLAEMYAYSMAAAHLDLPHFQMENLMVSNTEAGGEGWPWVDALPDVCAPAVDGIFYPGQAIPSVLHYCQTFSIGTERFYKGGHRDEFINCQVRKRNGSQSACNLDSSKFAVSKRTSLPPSLNCQTPMMPQLSPGIGKIDFKAISFEKERERFKAARHAKRGGFAISILYQMLNWTIAHYQTTMCG